MSRERTQVPLDAGPSRTKPRETLHAPLPDGNRWLEVKTDNYTTDYFHVKPPGSRLAGQREPSLNPSSQDHEPPPSKKLRLGSPTLSSIHEQVKSSSTPRELSSGVGDVDTDAGPALNPEQEDLVQTILSGRNVFCTGSAGCGKSTVLKEAVRRLRDEGKSVSVLAPTGRAAIQVDGITTWSFMGWTPTNLKKPLGELKSLSWRKSVASRLKNVDVLIIDEISMLENHFFERMNQCLKDVRKYHVEEESRPAFGGVQLIVTGDFYQLPPTKPFGICLQCGLETESEGDSFTCEECQGFWYERMKWAFLSDAWKECNFVHVELRTIHRQTDQEFVDILQKIRVGERLGLNEADRLQKHPCDVDKAVYLFSSNEEVRRRNKQFFDALPSPKVTYRCLDSFQRVGKHDGHSAWTRTDPDNGSFMENKAHSFEPVVELKKGMLVILQVNLDLKSQLCNGSQGIICGFEEYDHRNLPRARGSPDHGGATDSGRLRGGDEENGLDGFTEPLLVLSKVHLEADQEGQSDLEVSTRGGTEIRGEFARYRHKQIRLFAEQQRHQKRRAWPIVQFSNGKRRTIYPECLVRTVCYKQPFCLLSRTQVPLIAGWAITIHKSQGMTLDKVIVDLERFFAEGQLYVALSRATSLWGLKVKDQRNRLKTESGANAEVQEFMRRLSPSSNTAIAESDEMKSALPQKGEFGFDDDDLDGLELDGLT